MAFYDQMQDMVRDLLKPDTDGGLGQGVIKIQRTSPGTPDPLNPYAPVTPVISESTIKGAVRGVDAKLVGTQAGETVLLSTDRVVITEALATPYKAGDTLTIDGRAVSILAVENIPAAGTVAAVRFTVRG